APVGGSDLRPSQAKLQRNVDVTQVEQRSIVYHVETIGVLEAEAMTDIAAGVTRVVGEGLFREGDEVKPGTILVKVGQARYESEEQAARAAVERGRAAADLARDLILRAERAGRGTSEEEKARLRGGLNIAEAEHRQAQANLIKAKNNLDRSRVC